MTRRAFGLDADRVIMGVLKCWPTAGREPSDGSQNRGQLLATCSAPTPWVWVWCEKCQHHAPLACAVAVIRWGANTSSDRLRQRARCTKCGHKGATLQHPGWAGNHIGFQPFPTSVEPSSPS
jgi:hypothetical protein